MSARRRLELALALALAVVSVGGGFPEMAQADGDARAIAKDVHSKGHYPSELEESPTEKKPSGSYGNGKGLGFSLPNLDAASVVLAVIVTAAILALIAYFISRAPRGAAQVVRGARRVRGKRTRKGSEGVNVVSEDPWLVDGDPDALAQAGQYERAIAALLLRALRSLGWGQHAVDRSRTPREVLRAVIVADPRRPLFADAVLVAELVRFGGRPANEEVFTNMRSLVMRITETRASA